MDEIRTDAPVLKENDWQEVIEQTEKQIKGTMIMLEVQKQILYRARLEFNLLKHDRETAQEEAAEKKKGKNKDYVQ